MPHTPQQNPCHWSIFLDTLLFQDLTTHNSCSAHSIPLPREVLDDVPIARLPRRLELTTMEIHPISRHANPPLASPPHKASYDSMWLLSGWPHASHSHSTPHNSVSR